jgi:hypothetical protein
LGLTTNTREVSGISFGLRARENISETLGAPRIENVWEPLVHVISVFILRCFAISPTSVLVCSHSSQNTEQQLPYTAFSVWHLCTVETQSARISKSRPLYPMVSQVTITCNHPPGSSVGSHVLSPSDFHKQLYTLNYSLYYFTIYYSLQMFTHECDVEKSTHY